MGAIPSSMRIIRFTRFGPAAEVLELRTVATPRPGPGEVLVRVEASGLNPHDTKKRSGWLGLPLPPGGLIPHSDGAGIIEAVGPGVSPARIGERVFVFGAASDGFDGTAADYVRLPADRAAPLPDRCSFSEGAAIGIPALTAYYAVLWPGPVAGRTVLVHGGAGAVGAMAVDMASWAGARVIATVSSQEKAEIARAYGADLVVDYRREDVRAAVAEATGGEGADLVVDVDFGANLDIDAACVRENGRIASYSSTSNRRPVLPYYDFALKGVTLHFVQGMNMPGTVRREGARTIAALLERGRLRPRIAARFPLEQTAAAHELVESGKSVGNVVVIPGDAE